MQWRPTWDLKSIPEDLFREELARRRQRINLVPMGECDLCGEETAWMGKQVRCDHCGQGVYQLASGPDKY